MPRRSPLKVELQVAGEFSGQPRIMAQYAGDWYRVQEVQFLDDFSRRSWLQIHVPSVDLNIILEGESDRAARDLFTMITANRTTQKSFRKGPNTYAKKPVSK